MLKRVWCDKYQNWCDLVYNSTCNEFFTTGGCIYGRTIVTLKDNNWKEYKDYKKMEYKK